MARDDPNLPDFHPEYTMVREVAQGAFTLLYEAVSMHPRLRDRRVVLQVLRSREHARWFLRMAQLAAYFQHPNIVPCHAVGESRHFLYIARAFVKGDDVQNGIGCKGKWSCTQVVRIIREVAAALDYAHAAGVVHGYIHPRHILHGEDGHIWLIGFGEYPPPDSGLFKAYGSEIHLAPEQIQSGEHLTPRTDVYALSETAVWLLCGNHPYRDAHWIGLQAAKLKNPGASIRRLRPEISASVAEVLARGMAPQPENRFRSAGEFAVAFAAAV
jgi:serine/threonine protein kinase